MCCSTINYHMAMIKNPNAFPLRPQYLIPTPHVHRSPIQHSTPIPLPLAPGAGATAALSILQSQGPSRDVTSPRSQKSKPQFPPFRANARSPRQTRQTLHGKGLAPRKQRIDPTHATLASNRVTQHTRGKSRKPASQPAIECANTPLQRRRRFAL